MDQEKKPKWIIENNMHRKKNRKKMSNSEWIRGEDTKHHYILCIKNEAFASESNHWIYSSNDDLFKDKVQKCKSWVNKDFNVQVVTCTLASSFLLRFFVWLMQWDYCHVLWKQY